VPDAVPEGGFATFRSNDPNAQICVEDGKPVIFLFSITGCPNCKWIKSTFDETVKEYVGSGKIIARHWELDTKDDSLTAGVETSVPESDFAVYKAFNPRDTVPTFVFGCKYYRVGGGYEKQNDLDSEEREFRMVIEHLIESSESA
jgi:thiol-disulfide isomerase/thioredoxin